MFDILNKFTSIFTFKAPVTAIELQSYVITSLSVLRMMVYFLMIIIFFLSLAMIVVSQKKPIVIRVDELGHVDTVKNYASNHSITEVEVNAFAKEFLISIVEINSMTIKQDLSRASRACPHKEISS